MRFKTYGILVMTLFLLGLSSCNRQKTIPDDTLSDIFRDMYLSNAFANQAGSINYDSINIYEPILNGYGYDSRDFIHTVSSFTKRKSARLSDIVDDAIEKLDAMNAVLTRRVQILDKVDSIAYSMSKETVYADSLIQIRRLADSAKMTVTIPAEPGRYDIAYYYRQDSLDTNRPLTNRHSIKDGSGNSIGGNSARLRHKERTLYTGNLEAPTGTRELILTFGNYPASARAPIILDIDSLTVVHYPPKEVALEKMLRSHLDYPLIINGRPYYEYYNLPADSSTLHILPPLAPQEPDSLAVR